MSDEHTSCCLTVIIKYRENNDKKMLLPTCISGFNKIDIYILYNMLLTIVI